MGSTRSSSLAIILAKGERVALAHVYWLSSFSSLYTRLDECVNNIAHYGGRYDVVTTRILDFYKSSCGSGLEQLLISPYNSQMSRRSKQSWEE